MTNSESVLLPRTPSGVQNGVKLNYCGSHTSLSSRDENNDDHVSFEVGGSEYIPLHERINKKINDKVPFFSLEFFPPKTANGVANFFTRLDRYNEGNPMFVDITWHMGSDPGNLRKETSSTSIAVGILNYCRVDTMLHMTCCQYSKDQTLEHLRQCKAQGIRNILALRGDYPPAVNGEEVPIYNYRAVDLIRWIKEEFGDYFTICCSGYPLGHPQAPSYEDDLKFLKDKVDAGAHFIITQLFFECETFEKFVRDCRAIGITIPIIPGIMPIMGYESIRRIAALSQLDIPEHIMRDLEPIKHDDDAVRNYGTQRAVEMCKRLLDNGSAPSVHLYTMNREGVVREILTEVGLWQKKSKRSLPWQPHGGNHPIRCKEDVRPIFWSGRPKSYIYRTRDWDDFPNGRWGNSSSPAFGDLQDYYMFHLKSQIGKDEYLKMYGELESIDDVKDVFVNFITQKPNRNGVVVRCLPWDEQESGPQDETSLISEQLLWCNKHGILTINSQPAVDGAPSTDTLVGWGKPGGYCYQKAYLECFIPREAVNHLIAVVTEQYNPRINFHVINHDGSVEHMNSEATTPIAVTWGVFPGAEIAQPTVVDPLSFRAWKDEAFDIWLRNWGGIYPKDSVSRKVIQNIHDEFCLLTLVDNDFQKRTVIFELLEQVLKRTIQD